MSPEEHSERIQRGRSASAAIGFIEEFLEDSKAKLISRAVALYRADKLSHDQAIGTLAGLAALEDLIKQLEYAENQGISSAQQELGASNAQG